MDTVSLPLAFLAGLVSFASPCFLPVVPVFLAYLTGDSGTGTARPVAAGSVAAGPVAAASGTRRLADMPAAAGSAGGFITAADRVSAARTPQASVTRTRALVNAGAFVGAFMVVFVALWVAVATFGFVVGGAKSWFRIIGGIIIIIFGVGMMGWLRVPGLQNTWRPLERLGATRAGPTPGKSALLGLAFGAGWSPCIGPVLGAIIGLALTTGSMAAGTGLLVVYGLGLGLPFLLLAWGFGGLAGRLTWLQSHQRGLQMFAGILLLVVGFLLLADLWAPLTGSLWGGF